MQLDMHFYGVYALARAAGIKPEEIEMTKRLLEAVRKNLKD